MLYVKCVLAGIGMMFAVWILSLFAWYFFWIRPEVAKLVPSGTGVGIDPRSFIRPVFWLIGAIGFVAGALWTYRTAR